MDLRAGRFYAWLRPTRTISPSFIASLCSSDIVGLETATANVLWYRRRAWAAFIGDFWVRQSSLIGWWSFQDTLYRAHSAEMCPTSRWIDSKSTFSSIEKNWTALPAALQTPPVLLAQSAALLLIYNNRLRLFRPIFFWARLLFGESSEICFFRTFIFKLKSERT